MLKKVIFSVIIAAMFVTCPCRASSATRRPNVLVILVDDMGYNGISCLGNKPWKTPNIDRLAAEGMLFTDAYASPVCSPTRASLLTGKNPARLDITNWIPGWAEKYANPKLIERPFKHHLPLSEFTLAEAFREQGYATAHVGKWHLGEGLHTMPDKQGFEHAYLISWSNLGSWFAGKEESQVTGFFHHDAPGRQFLTEHLADQAIDWLNHRGSRPFFLYFSTHVVHKPIAAKEQVLQKYLDRNVPATGADAADYAAMHEHMDRAIGRLINHLEELGQDENTIVVFLSDNGGREPQTVNTPLRGGKGELLEGGIRVPLIMRWPKRIVAASKSDVPVVTDDLYPTLLDLAGLPAKPQQHLDGVSFASVLRGQVDRLDREALYWHYPHYTSKRCGQPSSAVRKGDWKLIEFLEDGRLELYNLRDDIGETVNRAHNRPDRVSELKQLLDAWRNRLNVKMPVPNPEYDPAEPSGWPQRLAQ